MWEIDLSNQIITFLSSILLGIFFGVVFYTLEAIRRTDKINGLRLWINDILFFLFVGFTTYCFLFVRVNGEIRGFVILGEGLGFWCFKTAFSKFLIKTVSIIYSFIKRIIYITSSKIKELINKTYRFFSKLLEKVKYLFKKRLKTEEDIVYTEKNGIRGSDTDERQG